MPEIIDISSIIDDLALEVPTEAVERTIRAAIGRSAGRLGARIIRHGSQILRGRRLRIQGFEERLYDRWAYPLDLYELCLYLAQECGDQFNDQLRAHAAGLNDCKFEALVRLQAAAARISGEIYKLLLGGYANGAHGRWRTLHETAVVALFLAEENNETAEKFLLHQFVKSYEDAQDYQKYATSLGEELLSDAEMAAIDKRYNLVIDRFGKGFEKPYGWARSALESRNPSLKGQKLGFKQLENAVKIEHWTPHYRLASHAVHASATSIRYGLGTREDTPVILAGPSNVDLTEAGRGALVSLVLATSSFLCYQKTQPTLEDMESSLSMTAMVQALNALTDVAIKAFFKVDQELENEIVAEAKKMASNL